MVLRLLLTHPRIRGIRVSTLYKVAVMIDSKLLDILACPVCREDLGYDARTETLTCTGCGRQFKVENGIPVMTVEEEPPSE